MHICSCSDFAHQKGLTLARNELKLAICVEAPCADFAAAMPPNRSVELLKIHATLSMHCTNTTCPGRVELC